MGQPKSPGKLTTRLPAWRPQKRYRTTGPEDGPDLELGARSLKA